MNAIHAHDPVSSFVTCSWSRTVKRLARFAALSTLLLAIPCVAAGAAESRSLTIGSAPQSGLESVDGEILKPFEVMRRVGLLNLAPADVHSAIAGDDRVEEIALEWFPGESATFDFTRSDQSIVGSISWNGQLRSEESEGYLTLTASSQSVSGVLVVGFDRYLIRSVDGMRALVGQVDDTRLARCLMPSNTDQPEPRPAEASKQRAAALLPSPRSTAKTATNVIDLIVYYTPEVANNYFLQDPTPWQQI